MQILCTPGRLGAVAMKEVQIDHLTPATHMNRLIRREDDVSLDHVAGVRGPYMRMKRIVYQHIILRGPKKALAELDSAA